MATYTANQLSGTGAPTETLSGTKTFTFNNFNSGSGYFTIETLKNNTGSYDASSNTNTVGTYNNFNGINEATLVTSSYIASVVVPSGNSSFQFAPTTTVAVSSSYLRAAGNISLTIS